MSLHTESTSYPTGQLLYIIGNGFDLAHELPTRYEDFHQWLIQKEETIFIRRFEKLYSDVNVNGLWSDLERALGNVSLKDAIEYDCNYQDCCDDIEGENSSHDAYICGENLNNVVDLLPRYLKEWVESINVQDTLHVYHLIKDAQFLSFNYTRTIEKVYDIENVFHIHEITFGNRPLVVGYGEALFEEEDNIQSIQSYESINVPRIKNILSHNRKPVDAILKEQETIKWLKSLLNISEVIVIGCSCSSIDKPYFSAIAKAIKSNAIWHFHIYNRKDINKFKNFADTIIYGGQVFDIL